jgi:hypothetical protein
MTTQTWPMRPSGDPQFDMPAVEYIYGLYNDAVSISVYRLLTMSAAQRKSASTRHAMGIVNIHRTETLIRARCFDFRSVVCV